MSQESTIEPSVHPMRKTRLEKVTVHIAVGQSGEQLEKAMKILSQLTGRKPCQRLAKHTIKDFGIREGEPISCMVTLRGGDAEQFMKQALEAVGKTLKLSSFDNYGNLSFGIKEHIDIPGTKYVPEIGIFGMNISCTLDRPGYRVKRRRIRRSDIGKAHWVGRSDAIQFAKDNFSIKILEETQTG